MSDVNPNHVKALFFEALDLPPEAVDGFLQRSCGDDLALLQEVRTLLDYHHDSELIAAPDAGIQERKTDPLELCGSELEGRYRVDAHVAEGGFGHVYKGWHLLWDVPVAIKIFKPLGDENQAERLRRAFLREGALLNRLSRRTHAIVQSYDVGTVDLSAVGRGLPTPRSSAGGERVLYTVIEWLDGCPLRSLIGRAEGWSLSQATALLEPIADALALCHELGVVHRDVTPGNIFVQTSASDVPPPGGSSRHGAGPKLLDFGIAKEAAPGRGFVTTATGFAALTVDYAAPEQLDGRVTGPWTDIYAFAIVLSELLLGRHPFEGLGPLERMMAVADPDRRPTPGANGLALPAHVERCFAKALSMNPGERYQSMRDFWAELTAEVSR